VPYADNRTFDKQPARQLDDLARGRAVVEAVRVEAPLLYPSASSLRDLEMRLNADTPRPVPGKGSARYRSPRRSRT
jgi:hypothetical protein